MVKHVSYNAVKMSPLCRSKHRQNFHWGYFIFSSVLGYIFSKGRPRGRHHRYAPRNQIPTSVHCAITLQFNNISNIRYTSNASNQGSKPLQKKPRCCLAVCLLMTTLNSVIIVTNNIIHCESERGGVVTHPPPPFMDPPLRRVGVGKKGCGIGRGGRVGVGWEGVVWGRFGVCVWRERSGSN